MGVGICVRVILISGGHASHLGFFFKIPVWGPTLDHSYQNLWGWGRSINTSRI